MSGGWFSLNDSKAQHMHLYSAGWPFSAVLDHIHFVSYVIAHCSGRPGILAFCTDHPPSLGWSHAKQKDFSNRRQRLHLQHLLLALIQFTFSSYQGWQSSYIDWFSVLMHHSSGRSYCLSGLGSQMVCDGIRWWLSDTLVVISLGSRTDMDWNMHQFMYSPWIGWRNRCMFSQMTELRR